MQKRSRIYYVFLCICRSQFRALSNYLQLKQTLFFIFFGSVPLGESGSEFLICGVPLEQMLFQISDLSNPLWTRIHRITDLSDLQTDHQINDPARSFG